MHKIKVRDLLCCGVCRLAGRPEFVEKLIVTGGTPLQGEIRIQGSKNAVLPILAACLLGEGPCEIENCPKIKDVEDTVHILRELGCQVERSGKTVRIDAEMAAGYEIIGGEAARIRSSVLFLGALLGKMKKAVLPKPGGCAIGKRPIDLHLAALERLGAVFSCEEEAITAEGSGLHCGTIRLGLPSVGATENSILAAVLLPGETRIEHAAQEPEIDELIRFLNLRGGKLQRVGDAIVIEGGRRLHPVRFQIASDRIVAGTYLFAAAAAGGELHLQNYAVDDTLARVLLQMGGACWLDHLGGMYFQMKHRPGAIPKIRTAPYPGFPTDLQSPLMAVCARASGQSRIWETVFESRFRTAWELQKMGAEISVQGNLATIEGKERLHAATLRAPDLRGGAALVVAALFADGISEISGLEYISRGYEDIGADLRLLGARIYRHERR